MKDLILLFSLVLVPTLAYKESLQTKLNFSNSTIHKRHKRDWIWNYMHITEEMSSPLPHYVGKIISSVRNKNAKYVLEGEYANTIFKVDEETGDIYAFERLDREKKSEYELTALIIDKITNQRMEPPSTFVIKVHDINDNVPIFVQKVFNGSVPEMSSVGTSVTKVTAVDADDPTIADHAKVIYQVIEGENYFTVDESGVISTATANLDREAQPTYKIVVKAKDSLGNTGREASIATVFITLLDINDNFPTFKKESFHFKVPENIQIKDEVGRLEVVDVDEPQNRNTTYNFVRGYFQDTFKIITIPSTNEGIIKPQKPLNYEEIKEYKFNVEATDPTVIPRYYKPGGSKSIASITIEVLDVDEPPVFSPSLYIFKVEENNPQKNKQIGTVSAKDPDAANRAIRYIPRISSPPGNYIKISDTGMVFLNQALDRETSAWYNITIRAVELADKNTLSDKESQAHIHIQVIDVNDNAPELTYPEEPRVCENAEPGQVVTRISATDKDEMLPGVYFKYSLATEDSNFTLSDNHDNTANVTVKYGQFNRELAKTHFLTVVISDNGKPALTSTNTLPISICKCNERGEVTFCEASAKTVGVSIQALVAIFVCILTIIVITLLLFLRKRHKKDLNVLRNNVAEIHEQLVTYDEEGGGEMDTTSYDVSVLNSARKNTMKPPRLNLEPVLSPYAQIQKPTENGHFGTGEMETMIEEKKDEADNDGDLLPYDTLHIYGYEGAESIAESLSSLESGSSDSDIDYDFLNDWGPRFKMLAELYGSEPTIDFVY